MSWPFSAPTVTVAIGVPLTPMVESRATLPASLTRGDAFWIFPLRRLGSRLPVMRSPLARVTLGVAILMDVLRVFLPSLITVFGSAGSTPAELIGVYALV